jgi:RND family efflux transporter MFP subunit
MLRRHPVRSVATITFAGTLLFGSGCRESEPVQELPPRAIRWMKVTGDLPADERVISGIVTAVDETSLAFEVGGTVLDVAVRLGDEVQRDDVLARLDPEPFELAVRDAEAELADVIARGQAAEANYQRTRELFEADVASRQDLDRDIARRGSTASRADAARARLKLAQRDLRRSVLRAPFDGSISVRNVDPAMELASGEIAFEMDSRESGLRIEVQVPETLISRVERGAEVGVRFPSVGARTGEAQRAAARALISEVGTRAGSGNAFPVRADFIEPPPGVRPGMTAEVALSLARVDVESLGIDGFLVPFSAVHVGGEEQFSVFVFDEGSSSVRRRPVETAGVRDNEVAVLSGLEDGDVIATAGVSFLSDGQTVRLLETELAAPAR